MSEFKDLHTEELILEDEYNQVPNMGHLERIIGIFTKPQEVLMDINRKPKIWIPLIIVMILTSAVAYLNVDFIKEIQRQAMVTATLNQGGQVPLDGFVGLSEKIAYVTVLGAGLGAGLGVALMSLITHGVSTFFGGEGSFKKIFSASLYVYFIPLLGSAIAGLVGLALNLDLLTFSPAVLLDSSQVGKPFFTFLSTFDIFNLWKIGVMMIAVRTIEAISTKKAAIVVLSMTVLGLLFQIVPNLGK